MYYLKGNYVLSPAPTSDFGMAVPENGHFNLQSSKLQFSFTANIMAFHYRHQQVNAFSVYHENSAIRLWAG
jgi:hypothetical protein